MPGSGILAWLRERWLLLLLCVGLPLAEMGVLEALGIPSGLGLAGQATAPGPFGVFHDLRWLFVFHDSILGFGLAAIALVAGRGSARGPAGAQRLAGAAAALRHACCGTR